MAEGAFTSSILPVRTKAFVFAVVARTLECDACEAEARRILSAEGVDATTVDEALTHLASPGLTDIETKAIPVARSTVRGQPAEIQAKVKGLRDQLAPEQFVEFIAVAALANTFSRLSCLMYRC
jgi:alkylhydroperoxidase family enzyme